MTSFSNRTTTKGRAFGATTLFLAPILAAIALAAPVQADADALQSVEFFSIASFGTSGAVTTGNWDGLHGDDRGGMAYSPYYGVLYTGDYRTTAFYPSLNGYYAYWGGPIDGLMSDHKSGGVMTLGTSSGYCQNGGGYFPNCGSQFTHLWNVAYGYNNALSSPIPLVSGAGIYSGYGEALVISNNVGYLVKYATGQVTNLGAMARPAAASGCENWANWGILERSDQGLSVVYARYTGIDRLNLGTGAITPLITGVTMSDTCSIVAAPDLNRWYWHTEGCVSFVQPSCYGEMMGYASATYVKETITNQMDTDGDFWSDYQEYLCGSNRKDELSFPTVECTGRAPDRLTVGNAARPVDGVAAAVAPAIAAQDADGDLVADAAESRACGTGAVANALNTAGGVAGTCVSGTNHSLGGTLSAWLNARGAPANQAIADADLSDLQGQGLPKWINLNEIPCSIEDANTADDGVCSGSGAFQTYTPPAAPSP